MYLETVLWKMHWAKMQGLIQERICMSVLIAEASQMGSDVWCIVTMDYYVNINNAVLIYATT